MIRWLYSLILWLAQPLLRAKLARRGVEEPGYLEAVHERFGRYDGAAAQWPASQRQRVRAGNRRGPALRTAPVVVWIHAVSLGETRAAAILVGALRSRLPGMRLLLTHGTATGRAEGARLLAAGDLQVWQPWDTQGATARFVRHFRPRVGILMETEIWPNLTAACAAAGVPLVLANARLNPRSLAQAQRMAWLARPAFGALAAVWAQTEPDAERLRSIGAPVRGVFGNLKFDATPDAAQLAQGAVWRAGTARPVVLFASAREGEEALLLQALQWQLAQSDSALPIQWLIVPRHPQRFDEVAALIAQHGFAVSRRSAWGDERVVGGDANAATFGATASEGAGTAGGGGGPQGGRALMPAATPRSSGRTPTIWLGDTLGEMALYYAMSDVALLGGSFAPLGGQNLIEAAACGCPVVMGPHTFNFSEAAELAEQAGAAVRAPDLSAALAVAAAIAREPARRAAKAQAARDFAAAHRGAAAHTVDAVLALLEVAPRVASANE